MPLKLAIVGRPNVGKSRLFNRLAGRTAAIVHDTPGVTRDRQAVDAEYEGLSLRLIDTAGFEEAATGSVANRMTKQTLTAIAEAEALLFLIDARAGVTAGDEIIAQTLRKSGKPVILARQQVRSAASPRPRKPMAWAWASHSRFPPSTIWAWRITSRRWKRLPRRRAWKKNTTTKNPEPEDAEEDEFSEDDEPEEDVVVNYLDRPLRLALVGRPNVGKSSLFNQLLGEERSLVGPEAGLTRDAITAPWMAGERAVLLHDTAGLRKKARVAGETLEEMSVASTLESIRFADCVIVMIDACAPFEKQDLTIADLIAREGRAIVFAINKWDLLENKEPACRFQRMVAKSSTGCCRRWRARR